MFNISQTLLLLLLHTLFVFPIASLTARIPSAPRLRDPPCTGSYNWKNDSFKPNDCIDAIWNFQQAEVRKHGTKEYEFVSVQGKSKTPYPTMQTPRRYTAGTCTLMIAMLNLFPPRDLPDPPRGPPLMSSDVSTFYDLHESAIKVFQTCVNWLHQVGYQDVGMIGSLGVFLMQTDSFEDNFIPPGVHSFGETAKGENGTVMTSVAETA